MQQISHSIPPNGIETFLNASESFDLAPVGLGSMQDQAKQLAEYGRHGDIYVVHAAEGETVVPMEVFEANPKVKELLFKQMEEMGLDPQEFVVGDELNSINPVTGMPEFFLKKIFRGVKKAIKGVVKFAKKAAPIVLPIAAAMFGFPFLSPTYFAAGSFGASALAGGLATLAQGGSFKDALKSGLMSGGITSLTAGVMGPGTFTENVGKSFYNPGAPTFEQSVNRFLKEGPRLPWQSTEGAPGAQSSFEIDPGRDLAGIADFGAPPPSNLAGTPSNVDLANVSAERPSWYNPGQQPSLDQLKAEGRAWDTAHRGTDAFSHQPKLHRKALAAQNKFSQIAKTLDAPGFADTVTGSYKPPSVLGSETLGEGLDYFTGGKSWTNAEILRKAGLTPDVEGFLSAQQVNALTKRAAEVASNINPNIIQKWGPTAALGTGAAYAFGAFDSDPPPPGMSDEEWEEMKRKARNPYWYPTQNEGESDADFAARSKRLRAPYEISKGALDPYRFSTFNQGGHVQGYNTGGEAEANPFWNPKREAGEDDATYNARVENVRKPYSFSSSSLDPYLFLRDIDPSYPGPPSNGGGGGGGGGNGGGGNGGGGHWSDALPTGLRYKDNRLEIDPIYSASRPSTGSTWGWESDQDDDYNYFDYFNPQSYLRALYDRGNVRDLGGGFSLGATDSGQDEDGNFTTHFRITGPGDYSYLPLINKNPDQLSHGGMAQFPRREMLVEGPGTERSDDIPAMLSDGEFVWNSKAVRGADPTGQGDRYRGAQNLYDMMRNFEMRA